eukprot:Selendium_serpulae@DN4572_c2_g1_i2.p1
MLEDVHAAVNILRRSDPRFRAETLHAIGTLNSDMNDQLLDFVERPLEVMWDPEAAKYFIASDYNRDGDSYRSPWTNNYYPNTEGSTDFGFPAEFIRQTEELYNSVFDEYRQTYFEGGVSSVYLWDVQGGGFSGAFLVKKEMETLTDLDGGSWHGIHIIEVTPASSHVVYKLNSTVLTTFRQSRSTGDTTMGATLTRQAEQHRKLTDGTAGGLLNRSPQQQSSAQTAQTPHLVFVGRMIEEMESMLSKSFEQIYIAKTRELVGGVRSVTEMKANWASRPQPHSGTAHAEMTALLAGREQS